LCLSLQYEHVGVDGREEMCRFERWWFAE
jgi:hypothetical protein